MVQQTACRCTFPSRVTGHTKRPRSRRLAKRHNPSRSAHRIFTILPLRPRRTKICPENGSSFSVFCTFEARPLKPQRISVTPAMIQILVRYHREPPFSSLSNTLSKAGVTASCSFTVPPGNATSQQSTSAGNGTVRGAGATEGGTILTGSRSAGWLSVRFSFPCLYWWCQLNSGLSLIPCSRARRATLASGYIDSSTR